MRTSLLIEIPGRSPKDDEVETLGIGSSIPSFLCRYSFRLFLSSLKKTICFFYQFVNNHFGENDSDFGAKEKR